jgi:hypothetical protein
MARRPFSNTRAPNATAAWAALVAFGAAALASGCSFIFSEGAPQRHESLSSFQCGESYAPPILDTIAVGLFGVEIVRIAQNEDANVAMSSNPAQTRHDEHLALGLAAAFAVIDVASAVYGYEAVGSCREAQSALRVDSAAAGALPPPYGLPPSGEPPPLWPPRLAPPAPSTPATPSP